MIRRFGLHEVPAVSPFEPPPTQVSPCLNYFPFSATFLSLRYPFWPADKCIRRTRKLVDIPWCVCVRALTPLYRRVVRFARLSRGRRQKRTGSWAYVVRTEWRGSPRACCISTDFILHTYVRAWRDAFSFLERFAFGLQARRISFLRVLFFFFFLFFDSSTFDWVR